MSFNHHLHSLINLHVILSFSVICLLVSNVKCHKCYVCGPGASPSCDNFDPSLDIYTKECPVGSASCSLHLKTDDETVVQRSCELNGLSDCAVANGIKYCYCLQDLCNGFDKLATLQDDDDFGGSGDSTKSDVFFENTTETKKSASSLSSLQSSSVIVILITCLLH